MSAPTANELWQLSVAEASRLLAERQISSAELTDAYLQRIEAVDDRISAYITVTADLARQQAAEADRRIAAHHREGSPAAPLTGVPMQIKDLLCTNGIPTTCASEMLAEYVPVYDATAVARLREQSAVLLGKGNMDEFGMGSSTENSAFFPTRNPWDTGRVPGGSSGGSAAAVAAGAAPFALGTDTGGSIRQPASFCGVTGLKPTYGRVSRYGLVAYASSLDQVGPIARDAADCALILQAIAGHDPATPLRCPIRCPTIPPRSPATSPACAWACPASTSPRARGMDDGVRAAVTAAIDQMAALGAEIREVSLPTTQYALACYYIIAPSECSANLARYDGVKYGYSHQGDGDMWEAMERTRQHGFGPEVKRRIMLGAFALSSGYYDAYYHKAQQVRTLIRQDFARVFEEVDALAAPVSPVVAFPIGERTDDPVRMYLVDVYTLPVNMAGLPAMSVPCGFAPADSGQGLPVGLQLIGPHLSEGRLLNIAHTYQQATGWHRERPGI